MGERGRRERLDVLKKASRFVEDADMRRDFTVQMRTSGMPTAQVGNVEISFEGSRADNTAKRGGAGLASIEAAIASTIAGGGAKVVPPPSVVRPPGPPASASARMNQSARSNRAGAEAAVA